MSAPDCENVAAGAGVREASGAAGRAGMPPAATPSVGEVPGVPAFVRPSSVEPDEWRELARCSGVNPDLFFPERGASTYEAKQVCRACPVKAECLEYALVNGEKFGIWGGLSELDRRRLRRSRSIAVRGMGVVA